VPAQLVQRKRLALALNAGTDNHHLGCELPRRGLFGVWIDMHRLRGVEGKDGNPMNEVRVLSNSMLQNQDVLSTSYAMSMAASLGDASIKFSPEKTVLHKQLGDEIRLTEPEFLRLSEAFFEVLECRFAA